VLTLVEKYSDSPSDSKRKNMIETRRFERRRLSAEELCQVNLATFRESVNHCRWPREVIEKFLAVQV
jgi:hypothetical protein